MRVLYVKRKNRALRNGRTNMAGMHEKDGMAMSVRAGLFETEVVMWEAAGERHMDRTRDAQGANHGRPLLNSLRTSDSHLLRPSQLDAFMNSSICRKRSPFCRATGNDGSTLAAACCGCFGICVSGSVKGKQDKG